MNIQGVGTGGGAKSLNGGSARNRPPWHCCCAISSGERSYPHRTQNSGAGTKVAICDPSLTTECEPTYRFSGRVGIEISDSI